MNDTPVARATVTPIGVPFETGAIASFDRMSVGYDRVAVLSGLSLEIAQGDFIAAVGPSGTGKTTLLRALTGQVRRFAGSMELRSPEPDRDLRFGYVPQVETVNWNFPITVEQVVLLGLWRRTPWLPWTRRRDRDIAHDTLERLGIAELWGRQIRALSGGQQQRVFLARALVGNPDVLLLDEPTSGVDIRTRHEIMHLLLELNAAGTTIVLTTHDLNAVASHVNRILCISGGTIVGDGAPLDVLTPDVLYRTYGVEMVVVQQGSTIAVVESAETMAHATAAVP